MLYQITQNLYVNNKSLVNNMLYAYNIKDFPKDLQGRY